MVAMRDSSGMALAVERFAGWEPLGFEAGDENWYRFVANGPAAKTDPSGLDLTVITNRDAALWGGHSAVVIGNHDSGFTMYSYGSEVSGSDSGCPSSSGGSLSVFGPYNSFDRAMLEAYDQGYGTYFGWRTTPEEDSNAAQNAYAWKAYTYNVFWRNCADMVVEAARAADIEFKNTWRPNDVEWRNNGRADYSGSLKDYFGAIPLR